MEHFCMMTYFASDGHCYKKKSWVLSCCLVLHFFHMFCLKMQGNYSNVIMEQCWSLELFTCLFSSGVIHLDCQCSFGAPGVEVRSVNSVTFTLAVFLGISFRVRSFRRGRQCRRRTAVCRISWRSSMITSYQLGTCRYNKNLKQWLLVFTNRIQTLKINSIHFNLLCVWTCR